MISLPYPDPTPGDPQPPAAAESPAGSTSLGQVVQYLNVRKADRAITVQVGGRVEKRIALTATKDRGEHVEVGLIDDPIAVEIAARRLRVLPAPLITGPVTGTGVPRRRLPRRRSVRYLIRDGAISRLLRARTTHTENEHKRSG
jgi:hypothetical protein